MGVLLIPFTSTWVILFSLYWFMFMLFFDICVCVWWFFILLLSINNLLFYYNYFLNTSIVINYFTPLYQKLVDIKNTGHASMAFLHTTKEYL